MEPGDCPVPDSGSDSGSQEGARVIPYVMVPGSGSVRRFAPTAVLIATACLGVGLITHGAQSPTPPPQPDAAQAFPVHSAAPSPTPTPSPGAPKLFPLPPSAPTRIRIPSIRVSAPLTALTLGRNGRLTPPPDADRNLAGWYRAGTSPGATGTAVIAGHVDNERGPAVFYDLGALKKGDAIDVDRTDRDTAVFTIDAIEVYSDQDFPSKKVYGQAARPELRLITCGGGFDKARQHYLGNVVVYAHLTGDHQS